MLSSNISSSLSRITERERTRISLPKSDSRVITCRGSCISPSSSQAVWKSSVAQVVPPLLECSCAASANAETLSVRSWCDMKKDSAGVAGLTVGWGSCGSSSSKSVSTRRGSISSPVIEMYTGRTGRVANESYRDCTVEEFEGGEGGKRDTWVYYVCVQTIQVPGTASRSVKFSEFPSLPQQKNDDAADATRLEWIEGVYGVLRKRILFWYRHLAANQKRPARGTLRVNS